MKLTVNEIALKLGGEVQGDGALVIEAVAGVRDGGAGDIAFVSQDRYAPDAATTQVSALIVRRDWNRPTPATLIRVDDPEKAFAATAVLFAPPPFIAVPGVHASAVVSESARLGQRVSVGPCAVIGDGAIIGDDTVIHAQVHVGRGVRVGSRCVLHPHVSLREYVVLGDRVTLHDGTVIGSDGFGYAVDREGVRHKIPQIGTVVIGDDVEIGANTTVDRARFGKTRIGKGVKIDNLVQIAHNVVIGDHAVIIAQTGIAGSTVIGSRAILAGQAGVAGHLIVGAGAIVAAQSGVTKNIPAGATVMGFPAIPSREYTEQNAHVSRLPVLKKRVAELEARIKAMENSAKSG